MYIPMWLFISILCIVSFYLIVGLGEWQNNGGFVPATPPWYSIIPILVLVLYWIGQVVWWVAQWYYSVPKGSGP